MNGLVVANVGKNALASGMLVIGMDDLHGLTFAEWPAARRHQVAVFVFLHEHTAVCPVTGHRVEHRMILGQDRDPCAVLGPRRETVFIG